MTKLTGVGNPLRKAYLRRGLPLFIYLVLSICFASVPSTQGQGSELDWSDVERVWDYEDTAEPPYMVADQNRTVHAMNSRTSPEGAVGGIDITYRRWSGTQGWSNPVDVILSPRKNIARIRGLELGEEGYLHMVFYAGDEQDASIYYTTALASLADRAPSWSGPVMIGDRAGPISDAAFAGDGGDKLFVVYTGNREGLGAYATFSLDGGLTWSENESFHLSEQGQGPTHYSLLVDAKGRLHVVWSEADLLSGNGQTLYYARLDENQQGWTQPMVIARRESDDLEVDTPTLVEHDDRLILVYHDDFPTTRFMRQSLDNGASWTEAERLFPQVGSNGAASLVTDSQGNLYLHFGGRIGGNPDIHGMWQSTYQMGNFTSPVPVISGPRVVDEQGGDGFDPAEATTVVVQGNTILLTWTTDPGAGLNGVRSAYATTSASGLPLLPLPTLVPTVAPVRATETPPPSPVPTLTPLPDSASGNPTAAANSPMMPLLLGSVSVLALVGLIFAGKAVRRKG